MGAAVAAAGTAEEEGWAGVCAPAASRRAAAASSRSHTSDPDDPVTAGDVVGVAALLTPAATVPEDPTRVGEMR